MFLNVNFFLTVSRSDDSGHRPPLYVGCWHQDSDLTGVCYVTCPAVSLCAFCACLLIVSLTTDTCFCVNVPQVIILYLTGVCSVTCPSVSLCACLRIVWLTTDTCFCVNVPQVILLYLTGGTFTQKQVSVVSHTIRRHAQNAHKETAGHVTEHTPVR